MGQLRPFGWRPHRLIRFVGLPLGVVVERIARLSARRVGLALMYHRVDERHGDPERELVPALEAGLFEAQLRHLKRRYRIVLASELLEAVRRRRRGERVPVAVTFDDDHASHVSVTLPILRRVGVTATFFLSGASLERPQRFWFERLQAALDTWPDEVLAALPPAARAEVGTRSNDPRAVHAISEAVQRLTEEDRDTFAEQLLSLSPPEPEDAGMRAEDVRALVAAGCEIGFHTMRHHPLPTLSDGSLQRALREGREPLAALAGGALTLIAYPHGHVDARVAQAAQAAGFAAGFTTRPEAVRPDSDPLLLGRLLPSTWSIGHFALQLARRLVPGWTAGRRA